MASLPTLTVTLRLDESHRRSYTHGVPLNEDREYRLALEALDRAHARRQHGVRVHERWRPAAVVVWMSFVECFGLAVWASFFTEHLRLASIFITAAYVLAIAILGLVIPSTRVWPPMPTARR